MDGTKRVAAPLPCPSCDATGTEPGRRLRAWSEGFDGECSRCHGTGVVSCSLCSSTATRTAGDEPTCEACGALVDADAAAYEQTEVA